MDVRLLETFRAVVDHRSVMETAAAVRVTQPAVSAQIARVEQGLSFPLFDPSNERLKPPTEGMLFDAEGDKVLAGMDRLSEAAQQIPTAHQPAIALACASQTSARVGEWLPWPKPSTLPVHAVSLPAEWIGPWSIHYRQATFGTWASSHARSSLPSTTKLPPFARGTANRRSCAIVLVDADRQAWPALRLRRGCATDKKYRRSSHHRPGTVGRLQRHM